MVNSMTRLCMTMACAWPVLSNRVKSANGALVQEDEAADDYNMLSHSNHIESAADLGSSTAEFVANCINDGHPKPQCVVACFKTAIPHAAHHYVYGKGKKLGEGGFGEVFGGHVHQVISGSIDGLKEKDHIAIKTISQQKLDSLSTNAVAAVCDEAVIQRKLTLAGPHPNVLALYDMYVDQTGPGEFGVSMVLEFAKGKKIMGLPGKYGKRNAVRSHDLNGEIDMSMGCDAQDQADLVYECKMARVKEVFPQLLDALMFCHANGIAHQDIKGANVFLDGDTVKLGDFGLSRDMTKDFYLSSQFRGTLEYMPPEIVANGVNSTTTYQYDLRETDIWSLGVLLFEMIEGVTPFASKNFVQDTIASILAGRKVAELQLKGPDLKLYLLVESMLRKAEANKRLRGEALSKAVDITFDESFKAIEPWVVYTPSARVKGLFADPKDWQKLLTEVDLPQTSSDGLTWKKD